MKDRNISLLHQKRYRLIGSALVALCLVILALPSTASAQTHTLTIVSQETGLISSSSTVPALLGMANIACGTDNRYGSSLAAASTTYTKCTYTYDGDTQVTLVARPNHPYNFIGWLGDCNGGDTQFSITVDSPKRCQAVFAKPDGYVQIDASAGQIGRASNHRPEHVCAVTDLARIHCWGRGTSGQIGDGMSVNRNVPTLVSGITNAIAVSTGGLHTCAVLDDGAVRCWGFNNEGQIGDGGRDNRSLPATVTGLNNAISVSAGQEHTCALLATGAVQCWGDNTNGALGNSTRTDSLRPVTVLGITNAVAVAAANRHSCAVLANGVVRCWGIDEYRGDNDNPASDSLVPTTVSNITNAVTISAGVFNTCTVLSDGKVQCWGTQANGKLGNGVTSGIAHTPVAVTGLNTAVMVSVANSHGCAVLRDGQAKCWGASNANSDDSSDSAAVPRLGTGSRSGSTTPVDVADIQSVASIAAGRHTSCALLSNGLAYCWGADRDGEIGNGDATNAAGYANPQLVANQSTTTATVQKVAVVGNLFVFQTKAPAASGNWSINPNAPTGLRLNTVSGALYGIPTAAVAAANYTLTAGSSIALQLTVATPDDYVIRHLGNPHIPEHSTTGTEVSDFSLQLLYRPSNTILTSGVSWFLSATDLASSTNPFLVTTSGVAYVGRNIDVLDYERLSSSNHQYALIVQADTGIAGFHKTSSAIPIRVTNVLETLTIFDTSSALNTIPENSSTGTLISSISLVARDEGASTITAIWSITSSQTLFTISSMTGQITLAQSPDFEGQSSHTIVVQAVADNDINISNTIELTIGITNILENILVENVSPSTISSIRLTAEINDPVGGIQLVGREDFPGTPSLNGLTWSLTGNNAFTISSQTGSVHVASSLTELDLSASASITLTVSASKDGITSNELPLTVFITGVVNALKLHLKLFLEGPLQ